MARWIRKLRPLAISWSLAALTLLATAATVLAENDKGTWP